MFVYTSDIGSAGTDANVYMVAYGDKGKSDKITLDNKGDNFEKGQTDQFKIEMVEIGKPYKIRVWHDDAGMAAGWHLNKVSVIQWCQYGGNNNFSNILVWFVFDISYN